MYVDNLTREDVIERVGLDVFKAIFEVGASDEGEWPIFDQCVADAGLLQQPVTYIARVEISGGDYDGMYLEAVYYQPYEDASTCEALDDLTWTVDHYRIRD